MGLCLCIKGTYFFVTAVALVCDDRLENLPYYTGVDVGFLLGFGIGAKKAMAKQ